MRVDPRIEYLVTQAGFLTVFGAGAILLGFALLAFAVASADTVSAWMRWTLVIGGAAAFAARVLSVLSSRC